ncbi:MAG: lipopolysaccharide biosynthesis protein [candidate division Zixibacteria bacterium]|nr:lipopolysaccharide biosynthesis protein [Candidatus Tariuqbacter arcticus]
MLNDEVRQKTAKGFLWVSIYVGGARILQAATFLILGKLLEPEDFGAFALAMVLVNGLIMLREIGLTPALIQIRDDVDRAFRNSAVMLPFFGVLVFFVIFLIAPVYGRLAANESVVPIVKVLGLMAPLSSFGILPAVYLQRNLRFRKKALPEILSVTVGSGLSVFLAWQGFGVWSFIYGILSTEFIRTTAYWITVGFKFKPQVDFAVWKRLLKFGVQVSIGSTFGFLYTLVDRFIVGTHFIIEQLGYYSFSLQLANLLPNNLVLISNQLILPTLSSMQDEKQKFIRTYSLGLALFALIIIPVSAGIYLFGGDLLHWLYNNKWDDAALALKIFVFYGFSRAIGALNTEVFLSKGKPKYFTFLSAGKLLFCLLALPFVLRFDKMEAVAILFTFGLLAMTVMSFFLAAKLMEMKFWGIIKIFIPHIISIIAGCGAIFSLPNEMLLLRIALFYAVYAGTQFIFNRRFLASVKEFTTALLKKGEQD